MIPAINIEGLSYDYKGHWLIDRKKVLDNVSLSVSAGESFGFLGHNGAGKTTTIKSILGINKITIGKISIFGTPNKSAKARSLIGYLPEQPYFYDHLTVQEMLTMYATLSNVSRTEIKSACSKALELVKLEGRSGAKLRTLSKGLLQRAAMAQAIVANPKLLILDEPFSGLDPIGRKDFKDLLSALKAQGTTIFMSSHILTDVEFLCDRVSIMSKGVIKGIFSVAEIPALSAAQFELIIEDSEKNRVECSNYSANSNKYQNGKIVLLFNERDDANKALKSALEKNVRIDSFSTVQNSLEDVFVRLVKFDESKGA
jgi:ABC-2 type transport system ATP-binding protein